MVKKFTAVLGAALLSTQAFGFGAPDLLPAEQRQKEYKISTKVPAKKSFAKASIWAAKTFANSNEAIKLKDAEAGVIVAKGNLACGALKLGGGFASEERIDFTLEMTFEDKAVEVKATEVVGRSEGVYDDGARPSTKEEMAAAASQCIDPLVEKLKAALN